EAMADAADVAPRHAASCAGPRLADRHARRRESARGPLRAVPARRALHAPARPRVGLVADRAAADSYLGASVAAGRPALLPPVPAALPGARRAVRSRSVRSGDQQQPLR